MGDGLRVAVCTGEQVLPHLDDVARLRIAVFREFPYLYDGDPAYEANYLATYARSPGSVFVLVFDGERVVGASTGIPLADEGEAFQRPLRQHGIAPEDVFYFGESVLLPEYRGQGLGHRFFDEREGHAHRLAGFRWTAFAAVDRDADGPRRPPDYRGNEAFWQKRGYARQPGMTLRLAWKELGVRGETEKPLTFWLRPLESVPDAI